MNMHERMCFSHYEHWRTKEFEYGNGAKSSDLLRYSETDCCNRREFFVKYSQACYLWDCPELQVLSFLLGFLFDPRARVANLHVLDHIYKRGQRIDILHIVVSSRHILLCEAYSIDSHVLIFCEPESCVGECAWVRVETEACLSVWWHPISLTRKTTQQLTKTARVANELLNWATTEKQVKVKIDTSSWRSLLQHCAGRQEVDY